MARAVKGAGKGSALKRKDRRQTKFNAPVGPGSHKPIGIADKPDKSDVKPLLFGKDNKASDDKKKALGKLSKKRKAEGPGSGGGGGGGDATASGHVRDSNKFAKKSSGGKPGGGGKFFDNKGGGGGSNKYGGGEKMESTPYLGKKPPLSNKHQDAPKHIATVGG
jgi:hypothetical protein